MRTRLPRRTNAIAYGSSRNDGVWGDGLSLSVIPCLAGRQASGVQRSVGISFNPQTRHCERSLGWSSDWDEVWQSGESGLKLTFGRSCPCFQERDCHVTPTLSLMVLLAMTVWEDQIATSLRCSTFPASTGRWAHDDGVGGRDHLSSHVNVPTCTVSFSSFNCKVMDFCCWFFLP